MLTRLSDIFLHTSKFRAIALSAAALCGLALGTSACSSGRAGPRLLTAHQLTYRILPAPSGYQIDPAPHASGVMTRALFDQYGGAHSPSKLGFVTGFKQSYVNQGTGEALIVTAIEFSSSSDAKTYFTDTQSGTLKFAAAKLAPFPGIPGALEADGTKAYNHGYYHAIVDTANNFYFQVAYADPTSSSAPVELGPWAAIEYRVLKQV